MFGSNEQDAADLLSQVPSELPVLPLRNMVAFPFTVIPIAVGTPRSVRLVREVMNGDRLVVLATAHDP
ncbi:MAG: LON peptidase substrate-binding domain-containing protein, partial [Anaerolineae bacterium]|nr:LON peptidase substrate-binding domain-containing protein [Anaerolineae bacterium]